MLLKSNNNNIQNTLLISSSTNINQNKTLNLVQKTR